MTDEILTLEEVRKYLKIHKGTLYRLAQQRRIPAAKVGRIWRFKKERLDDWIDRQSEVK